jgi:hypothetical protein
VDAKTGQPPQPGDTGPVIMEAFKEGQGPTIENPLSDQMNPLLMPVPGGQGAEPAYNFPSEEPLGPAPVPGMETPEGQWQPENEGAERPRYLPPSRYNDRDTGGTGGLY